MKKRHYERYNKKLKVEDRVKYKLGGEMSFQELNCEEMDDRKTDPDGLTVVSPMAAIKPFPRLSIATPI